MKMRQKDLKFSDQKILFAICNFFKFDKNEKCNKKLQEVFLVWIDAGIYGHDGLRKTMINFKKKKEWRKREIFFR